MRGNGKIDPSWDSKEESAVGGVEVEEDQQKTPTEAEATSAADESATTSAGRLKRCQSDSGVTPATSLPKEENLESSKKEKLETSDKKATKQKNKSGERSKSASSDTDMEKHQAAKSAGADSSNQELKKSGQFMRFIKRTFSGKRGKRQTAVQEIHIAPDEDEAKWASRFGAGAGNNGGSGNNSRSSSGVSTHRTSENVEIVHDMHLERDTIHTPWKET